MEPCVESRDTWAVPFALRANVETVREADTLFK